MQARKFSLADQQWFSVISGDYNPIHIDPLYSRKSMFGEVIVHGIHLLLWAIHEWGTVLATPVGIKSLNVSFLKPVKLNQLVSAEVIFQSPNGCKIRLLVDKIVVTTIDIVYTPQTSEHSFSLSLVKDADKLPAAFDENMQRSAIDPCVFENGLQLVYGHLDRVLSGRQVMELFAITRIVGMKCPGINSIFSSLSIQFTDTSGDGPLYYEINSYHKKFSRLVVGLSSSVVTGSLVAFVRPSSRQQFSFGKAQEMVSHGIFTGQRALVIGGSRGLGEIFTKLLAAGGAAVLFTYHKGENEARLIHEDIGNKKTGFIQLDIADMPRTETIEQIAAFKPTHVYYFVTPFIFSTNKGKFNFEAFVHFSRFYLKGVYDVLGYCDPGSLTHLFYPSSVAIDELVDNMIEYSCSKIAGELLCDYLTKIYPNLKVGKPRFPRLDTDQTQTLIYTKTVDTEEVALNTLLEFAKL